MFEDKVALITGSGRGIGRATAEILSAGGAKVLLADLDREAVGEAARSLPGETAAWDGNLTDPGAPQEVVEAAVSEWGSLDIVVNNAGYTLDAPLHKLSDEDFQAMLDIHTITPFRILRAAAPHLREPAKRERADGLPRSRKVVNVTSVAAYGNPGQANYSSGKAAVIGMSKTLAREWGPLNICVNAVCFGLIDTRLTAVQSDETVIEVEDRKIAVGIPEPVRSQFTESLPLGRAGSVAEAAGGVAFLCSPWSDYVTGQVLNVTGGMPIGMTS